MGAENVCRFNFHFEYFGTTNDDVSSPELVTTWREINVARDGWDDTPTPMTVTEANCGKYSNCLYHSVTLLI